MMTDTPKRPFRTGQLVRYFETQSRWYFARVKRSLGEYVELRFFDRSHPILLPCADVEPVDEFLQERERAFSRTRSQLTACFYRREFGRLRESRAREMRGALRKAGISFSPAKWPSADTRVRLWRDTSVIERTGTDPLLDALLPQWLEPFVLPAGSRDPLGLQAPAEKLVNEVLPGLTVFTSRAGYYGFVTWAIRAVNTLSADSLPRRTRRHDVLNAFERALVLCEFVYHGLADDSCKLIGHRSKTRVLGSISGDRCRVPESILRNQSSTGSFRLFATSLVSLGLAEEAPELAADGLLPFRLTPIGNAVANAFQDRVDPAFTKFAMDERSQTRDVVRNWGERFCFSSIGRQRRYRDPLIRGLLLGNSSDAERRYRTVSQLFAAGLIDPDNRDVVKFDTVSEDDAAVLEESIDGSGLSNLDVVLHFYGCPPRDDLRSLQALSVFELLSLGLSAIFRAIVVSVADAGKSDLGRVTHAISVSGPLRMLSKVPMKSARPTTVRKLATNLLECDDAIEAAGFGGALLVRLLRDPLLGVVWPSLAQMVPEAAELVDICLRQRMDRSLHAVLPELVRSMVERHEFVSNRKSRQRWLFLDGKVLVRDDPHEMGLGLHALRFPQLGSLAYDMSLREEDLRHV